MTENTTRTIAVKQAKASDDDRETVREMLRLIESYAVNPVFVEDPGGEEQEIELNGGDFAQRLLILHDAAPGALSRVVWGYETLLQLCDADADVLDLRPDIKAMPETIERYEALCQTLAIRLALLGQAPFVESARVRVGLPEVAPLVTREACGQDVIDATQASRSLGYE